MTHRASFCFGKITSSSLAWIDEEKALKLLPLGTSDFENLRHRDQIYVDKTDMICELASVPGKFFFARPRRFGKSLLLSTFESLFRDGLKNFQGLK